MIRFIKNVIARFKTVKARRQHDELVKDYWEFAISLGDGMSYSFLGEPVIEGKGMKAAFEQLDKLEERYASLGYRIVPFDSWIDCGGYGKSIDHLWLVKRDPGERPRFTKDDMPIIEVPVPSKLLEIIEQTGKHVEAVRQDDGTYKYRVIE